MAQLDFATLVERNDRERLARDRVLRAAVIQIGQLGGQLGDHSLQSGAKNANGVSAAEVNVHTGLAAPQAASSSH